MSPGGARTVCALCSANAALKRSHILPRFVSRALHVPDGPTHALLCGECEELVGASESTFARVVFNPQMAKVRRGVKYEKWLLQFAASVCWRGLEAHLADNPSRLIPQLDSSRAAWRQFIRGQRADVGAHPIHLLVDEPVGEGEPIELEVVADCDASFVYARLGPLVLLGLATDQDRALWQGTRIHLEGKLKPRETVLPARYRDYLLAKTCRRPAN